MDPASGSHPGMPGISARLIALLLDMGEHRDVGMERVEGIRAEIRRYRSSCGCELGSAFALGAAVVFAIYFASGHGQWTGWGSAGSAVIWIIGLSVIGKLTGLGYAHVRLVQLGHLLDHELGLDSGDPATSIGRQKARHVRPSGIPAGSTQE